MHARNRIPSLMTACAIALTALIGLSACCTAKGGSGPGIAQPQPFPASDYPAEPVAVDCDSFSPRACCDAYSAECEACHAAARVEHRDWVARCRDLELQTSPDVGCSSPPALQPCCRALLPKCTECAAQNRATSAAYEAACGDGAANK